MHVLIYGKTVNESQVSAIQSLFDTLIRENATISIYEPYWEVLQPKVSVETQVQTVISHNGLKDKGVQFLLSLGGDGTILSAVTLVRNLDIPIMGINLGRLGFLASIEQKYIHRAIEYLKLGRYHLERRSMLSLEANKSLFDDIPFALNDFAILKRDDSSMIIIHTYVNGEFLNTYWADGLIVATPTGSTGYSLSCGGPILFPASKNLIITPVAPHNLNVRPIVLPDDSVISFTVEGRSDSFLCTLDSRFEVIHSGTKLSVRKCSFSIELVQLDEMSFSQTMRNKLMWGYDMRKYN
ncbi:MAG: NAD kinase [Saprospiraceae bacterium]|nr:NAD kinase [Saprospiraceae bacterium]